MDVLLPHYVKLFSHHLFFHYLPGFILSFRYFQKNNKMISLTTNSTSLRRALFCLHWNDILFSFALDEKMLIDRCASYWNNFLISFADSIDGTLLFEKANFTEFRKSWLNGEFAINCLRKSERYVEHASIIEKVISWLSSNIFYEIDALSLLEDFAITF